MKLIQFSLFICAALLIASACQLFSPSGAPATPVPATEAPAATAVEAVPYPEAGLGITQSPVNTAEAYPGAELAGTVVPVGAYPEPVGGNPNPTNAVAYPGPTAPALAARSDPVVPELKTGAEVKWEQVKEIVFSGQVVQVSQTHALKVTITLKDGRKLVTVEPGIDEIIKLVRECGELCKDIRIATE